MFYKTKMTKIITIKVLKCKRFVRIFVENKQVKEWKRVSFGRAMKDVSMIGNVLMNLGHHVQLELETLEE